MKKLFWIVLSIFIFSACAKQAQIKIDRYALVSRNNPINTELDSLSSLTVGNGDFAYTVDITGLQSFPEKYRNGVPLGTQSQWGWHSFPNPNNYSFNETLKEYNFRGKKEVYSVQTRENGRSKDAANWYRNNPHRMHLGYTGIELMNKSGKKASPEQLTDIRQELHLWEGIITSQFTLDSIPVNIKTVCHPKKDEITATIQSELISQNKLNINFKFPYPTGLHSDDASDWDAAQKHSSHIIEQDEKSCLIKRVLDETAYFVQVKWKGKAQVKQIEPHYFILKPDTTQSNFSFSFSYADQLPAGNNPMADSPFNESTEYWSSFWKKGGAIDFSQCKDQRAKELERRVILSQYLMAIQCAGQLPPQETGLTYNSWYGKFHLEMHWWHAVHFALWNRIDLLERSLSWYNKAFPIAEEIAQRQNFEGVRWMKMTDPSAKEAPSSVGSFLIWQQPHIIYFAELVYRDHPSKEVIWKYEKLVNATAEFMSSFATYDAEQDRYILKGLIPAQETLRASETINPPFELAYWYWGLSTAQKWRERAGLPRNKEWDKILDKLSPLTAKDGLYLAAEDAVDTYKDIRFTSDHPAVLGALGILPESQLVKPALMNNTLDWIWDNWNWNKTWGWDYPMTAMCAARLYQPQMAVDALLMDKRTNTYLPNGHNYQDKRLRVYLPGNGGLLTAVAMMCAGWDGNTKETPGFPHDENWNVIWEDLNPMP